jgi:hypothetical protein
LTQLSNEIVNLFEEYVVRLMIAVHGADRFLIPDNPPFIQRFGSPLKEREAMNSASEEVDWGGMTLIAKHRPEIIVREVSIAELHEPCLVNSLLKVSLGRLRGILQVRAPRT